MADEYSDDELNRYFSDPDYRRRQTGQPGDEAESPDASPTSSQPMSRKQKIRQAAYVLGSLVAIGLVAVLGLGFYMVGLDENTPSIQELENPTVDLATVAYTADGEVLARYAHQNRSWVPYDSMSTEVINALVATEDHRFREHWGIDVFRTVSAVLQTAFLGDLQGGSTISQQLARNLYDKQIGRETTIKRKLKEMRTAVELERRYTKREIIEMYLNTVGFSNNAFGIEAAAQTYFGKDAKELNTLEAATLIGMLKAVSYYNPVRNPENARARRNVVLRQMKKHGHISEEFYQEHKDDPVDAEYRSAEITASRAPYFAEHVRLWLNEWGKENGHNIYTEGLTVYTTLDSRMQEMAREAVNRQMKGLQAVVDYQWSRPDGYNLLARETGPYLERHDELAQPGGSEPFGYFWSSKRDLVRTFVKETPHYKQLVKKEDLGEDAALQRVLNDEAFMDSLKIAKTRLEAGMVSMNPHNGYVRTWVGGRDLKVDRYDHVSIAKRQPGSTFKPFTYTAAIDNGYSPYYTYKDTSFCHYNPEAVEGQREWCPENANTFTNRMMTLRQGLAQSKNSITGQLILDIGPETVEFYARRMGIKSDLQEVPSLALGTSNVTLLEMVSAYSTLANGGLYYEPVVVTRIEDQRGNVLYENQSTPEEAISEETAHTVVDMMRGVINQGTGRRINWQWGLGEYDLAGKTGTTQESADTWFMLMHPQLVAGAWVGFNDQRVTFRTGFWGQGAHAALFLVGDYFQQLTQAEDVQITKERFPAPASSDTTGVAPAEEQPGDDDNTIGW